MSGPQSDDRNSIQKGVDEASEQGQTDDTNRDTERPKEK